MDRLDKKILRLLQADATLAVADIAKRVGLSTTPCWRRIQKLEATLGFRLLERTTREVRLTQAGRSFYHDNADLLRGYASSIQLARRIVEDAWAFTSELGDRSHAARRG